MRKFANLVAQPSKENGDFKKVVVHDLSLFFKLWLPPSFSHAEVLLK
jgi:hypothetical protein